IAAVAISRSFTKAETASAGLFVSIAVLFLSVTGLLQWFTRIIPIPVVKGIQVGAALSLILSAGSNLLNPLRAVSPWHDNLLEAIAAFIVLLMTASLNRFPYALVIFVLGVVTAIIVIPPDELPTLRMWRPQAFVPSWTDIRVGSVDAGLGQL